MWPWGIQAHMSASPGNPSHGRFEGATAAAPHGRSSSDAMQFAGTGCAERRRGKPDRRLVGL